MRNIILMVCSLAFSSMAGADSMSLYDGLRPNGLNQFYETAYDACITKIKRAMHPQGLDLQMTYYGGRSQAANQRVLYINGKLVRDGKRVKVGIVCRTDYRGEKITGLKAAIGAHYAMDEGATSPALLADN